MNEEIKDDIRNACRVLREGGIILYPTDTIWGIGCDATNRDAVQRIYEIKQRENKKSMLVLLDNPAKLQQYVGDVPNLAWDLIDMADKPLTIIYDNARYLADNLIAEDGSIGIRITHEIFSNELCRQFRKPVVSTSANISGSESPLTFAQIDEQIKNAVDYVVKYNQNNQTRHQPSGIIKLNSKGEIKIIRK